MDDTIFVTREKLVSTLAEMYVFEGTDPEAIAEIESAIARLERDMLANPAEGAYIESAYLGIGVTLTRYADSARDAVRAGAALFDQLHGGDWRSRINRADLDVSSVDNCPLGQIYDGYENGLRAIRNAASARDIKLPPDYLKAFRGCSWGTDPENCCGEIAVRVLTLAWKELLESDKSVISDDLLNAK